MSVALPPMQSPTPVETPAQEAVSYPNLFLTRLQVEQIPDQLDHNVFVSVGAYNYETGQLSPNPDHQWFHRINGLLAEADRVPLLAQAMGLVVTVTGLLIQERVLLEQVGCRGRPRHQGRLGRATRRGQSPTGDSGMRFHVVALPHTWTAMSHSACAFTMKTLHFCEMMASLGHTVYHYGVEGSEVAHCAEDVTIMSRAEQEGFFGPYDPAALYEVDWSGKAPYWQLINERAAREINRRKQRGDFVCIIMGTLNRPLAEAVGNDVMVVEYGIGYNGTFAKYRVFESYAHMHKIWGAEGGFDPDGRFYDAVIPNYLNPADYPFQAEKGDYYLYLGRLIKRKGIHIAVETCRRLGAKLKIAGQGCVKVEGNAIYCSDGEVYRGDNLRIRRLRHRQQAGRPLRQGHRHVRPHHVHRAIRGRGDRVADGRHPGHHDRLGRISPRPSSTARPASAAAPWTIFSSPPERHQNSIPNTSTAAPSPTTAWTACGTATRNTSRCLRTCGTTAGTPSEIGPASIG